MIKYWTTTFYAIICCWKENWNKGRTIMIFVFRSHVVFVGLWLTFYFNSVWPYTVIRKICPAWVIKFCIWPPMFLLYAMARVLSVINLTISMNMCSLYQAVPGKWCGFWLPDDSIIDRHFVHFLTLITSLGSRHRNPIAWA